MHGSLGAVEDVGTEHTGKGSLTVRRETCENKDEYADKEQNDWRAHHKS